MGKPNKQVIMIQRGNYDKEDSIHYIGKSTKKASSAKCHLVTETNLTGLSDLGRYLKYA